MLAKNNGEQVTDYYGYGQPVFAPADSVVVSVMDGEPDEGVRQGRLARLMPGNLVVIQVAPREFLFMGHMRPGSLRVRAGEPAKAGQ